MPFLTFVAADPLSLTTSVLETARTFGIEGGAPTWLALDQAFEVHLPTFPPLEAFKALRTALTSQRIDILITPEGPARRKKLLLADMDSTIVTTETLDELSVAIGRHDEVAAITARAMNGELDFHAALRERVALLRGLPASALQDTFMKTLLSKGAETLVRTMIANGAMCALVSGGFTFFTEKVAALCGFHHHHGNTLEIKDGHLTGRVIEPLLDKDAKLALLRSYMRQWDLDPEDSLAVGDGANDLPMLGAAGLGVGYRPRPIVEDHVFNLIKYTDLTTLLYAQGYRADEFLHRQAH